MVPSAPSKTVASVLVNFRAIEVVGVGIGAGASSSFLQAPSPIATQNAAYAAPLFNEMLMIVIGKKIYRIVKSKNTSHSSAGEPGSTGNVT
jgi:hypothetical protein